MTQEYKSLDVLSFCRAWQPSTSEEFQTPSCYKLLHRRFVTQFKKTLVVERVQLQEVQGNGTLGPETGLVESFRAQDPAPNFKL